LTTSFPGKRLILGVIYFCVYFPSLTLREEQRLRVFENRVLRRIFGPQRYEAIGEWRRLRNEELYDLYYSANIIRVIESRRMGWAGHVACMGEEEKCIQGFGGEI
jgi:hypothetical protein